MKFKDLSLIFVIVIFTSAILIVVIRYFAPGLLGIPVDLQLVKSSKETPPFYENVFREIDQESKKYILNDPYTITRSKPFFEDIVLLGPNDILGFRNLSTPYNADIVITGDSQTYSENVSIEKSWPVILEKKLKNKHQKVYSMATGGWDATRYLEIYPKMLFFKPKITIVAYYTGNDPLESFISAYGNDRFDYIRPNKTIDKSDVPTVLHKWPVPKTHIWGIGFPNGFITGFTPYHRYRSNIEHPAVDAGYEIISLSAKAISTIAKNNDVIPVFTVIPTKELVYEKMVEKDDYKLAEGFRDHKDIYLKHVQAEKKRVKWLEGQIKNIKNAVYIDLIPALQKHALTELELYPSHSENGHPDIKGYEVIAETIFKSINNLISPPIRDGIVLRNITNKRQVVYLYRDGKIWSFASIDLLKELGWTVNSDTPKISATLLNRIERGGIINEMNKNDFQYP